MAQLKTQPNDQDVDAFLNEIDDQQKREDSYVILNLMKDVTGEPAKMWGNSIIGFGNYHYKYESGREGDWFLTGFSPRKNNLSLYIMAGFAHYDNMLGKLGKHKTGKSCLYINKIADIDLNILRSMVNQSVEYMRKKHF